MQVAQDEAEERELVDRVVDLRGAVERPDHAGGLPPPPVVRRPPRLRCLGARAVQARHSQPLPEPGGAHPVQVHELEHALQVRRETDEHGRGDAGHGRVVEPAGLGAHHPVHEPDDPRRRERRHQRQRQVVRDVRRQRRQLAQDAHDPVAEVVVADRLPAQPRVLGLADDVADRRVQEREVHRLLGVGDGRVVGAVERPGDEDDQERALGQQDAVALPPEELGELPPAAPRVPGRHGRHQDEQADDREAHARHQVQRAQGPRDVAEQQQAEDLADGVASVPEPREEEVADWEGRQTDNLDGGEPQNEAGHHVNDT